MAHDPRREDYQRMALRFVRTIDPADPEVTRAFASFGHKFAQERDSLPQTDADRAFHLVCLAAETVDYKLPFAGSDALAAELIRQGRSLLDEAISLDPMCFDAIRMKSGPEAAGVDKRHAFLAEREPEVRAACEQAAATVDDPDEERATLERSLAWRPYWRWLASLAEGALICGRNREAIRWCERLLETDRHDMSDARFTYAYALAKLEDEAGLDALEKRYEAISPTRGADDPWMLMARLALAHKGCRLTDAHELVERICRIYPGAAVTLLRQTELPDGEFARLNVAPYGEDELIVATSEGIVLLQEGADRTGRGVLGAWVANEVARMYPQVAAQVAEELRREGTQQK